MRSFAGAALDVIAREKMRDLLEAKAWAPPQHTAAKAITRDSIYTIHFFKHEKILEATPRN
jgi:hypothetical protein